MCKSFLIGSVTKVLSYEDLFAVNACEKSERDEKALAVRLEKEYEERIAAKKNAEKVDLVKNAKVEEKKSNEKSEPIKRSREIGDSDEKNRSGNEVTEEIDTIGNPLDGQTGALYAFSGLVDVYERQIAEYQDQNPKAEIVEDGAGILAGIDCESDYYTSFNTYLSKFIMLFDKDWYI